MSLKNSIPLEIFNQTDLPLPFKEKDATNLLTVIEKGENSSFSFVELVYVGENEIVSINKEFLKRDYVTDIISFRYNEDKSSQEIEGTLYCCLPRIIEQSKEFKESEEKEALRIIAHGLLHLIGYDDTSKKEKLKMTDLENKYLAEIY